MISSLLPILFLVPLSPLQEPATPQALRRGRPHVVVQMTGPGVDLDEMAARRKAGAGHEELLALAEALHEQAAELHQPVTRAISRLGGTVLDHFWMVNALEAEIPAGAWNAVAALPGVERVEPVLPVRLALKQATDANNHDSDGANLLTAPGGAPVNGTGVTLAIVDTGVDMNTSGTGRPHKAFFVDGDPANTSGGGMAGSRILSADDINLGDGNNDPEDHHGHGTSVAGIAAAADWNTTFNSDDGVAPRVWIRVFRIDSDTNLGSSDTTTISKAFQKVVTYPDVVAANMSFSGIPNPDFIHNRTMDRTVKKFDVAVVLAAGNSGNLLQAQGVLNAMTVGAVSEGSHNLASFSSRGPEDGRTYPLIVAQGQSITTVRQDAEGSDAGFGGTSGASPFGTGAAALIRQAAPSLTSGETNAIMMNTTGPAGGDSNGIGEGYLQIKAAVEAALAGDGLVRTLDGEGSVVNVWMNLSAGTPHSLTAVWQRQKQGDSTYTHATLRVFDPNGVEVANSLQPEDLHQKVTFTPAMAGLYRFEVLATAKEPALQDNRVFFAGVAGALPTDSVQLDLADTAAVGDVVPVQISGAPPSAPWKLYASLQRGPVFINGQPFDLGGTKVAASGTTDPSGAASFTLTIPGKISGRRVFLEAGVDMGGATFDSNLEVLDVP